MRWRPRVRNAPEALARRRLLHPGATVASLVCGLLAAVWSLRVFARPSALASSTPPNGASVVGERTRGNEPLHLGYDVESREAPAGHSSRVEVRAHGKRYLGYSFDGHVHTSHSRDARHDVAEVLALAQRAGLDAVMITDHGSSGARSDVANYTGPLSAIVGGEFGGTFGHALAWNFLDASRLHAAHPDDMPTLGRIAHERGALVVLAHPGWWIQGLEIDPRYYLEYDTIRRGGEGEAIDALELWNGTYPAPTMSLVESWISLLERNVYVPAVGGSDFHRLRGNSIGNPRNVVLCEVDEKGELREPLGRCILEASRIGRLFVTDGPSLAFTVGGRVSGEVLRATPGETVRVHVRADSADGGLLTVRRGREVILCETLEPGRPLERDVDLVVPQEDTFVYADIARLGPERGESGPSLLANPVRIDVGSEVVDWRGPTLSERPARVPAGFRRRAGTRR